MREGRRHRPASGDPREHHGGVPGTFSWRWAGPALWDARQWDIAPERPRVDGLLWGNASDRRKLETIPTPWRER